MGNSFEEHNSCVQSNISPKEFELVLMDRSADALERHWLAFSKNE